MAKLISIKPGIFKWTIKEGERLIGTLRIPVITQFFFSSGDATLQLNNELYNLTFPKRMADFLGVKELSILLTKKNETIYELDREMIGGATQYKFRWQEKDYRVLLKNNAWTVLNEEKTLFEISNKGIIFPRYEVLLSNESVPDNLIVAVIWATVCPIERVY
ncbi:MAG: hypothetical protein ACXWRE_15395 [Pseudobdellovibrionaceae bacterium]